MSYINVNFPVEIESLENWQPYMVGYKDGSSIQIGEVAQIHQESDADVVRRTVAWRGGPGKYPENFWPSGSTVGLVVSGLIHVHVLDEGRIDELKPGTFFRYDKGTRLQWEYLEPTIKIEFLNY